ncbi:MAG: hypothetical protein ACT4PV_09405 [Planctomycetaceae bacterium]
MCGFVLPQWRETVELCLRAARGFPGARRQDRDLGICVRGPVILELNSSGDLNGVQDASEEGAYRGRLKEFRSSTSFPDDHPRRAFVEAAALAGGGREGGRATPAPRRETSRGGEQASALRLRGGVR